MLVENWYYLGDLPLGVVAALRGGGETCRAIAREGGEFLVGEGDATRSVLLVEDRCAIGSVSVRGCRVLAQRLRPRSAKSLSSCFRALCS